MYVCMYVWQSKRRMPPEELMQRYPTSYAVTNHPTVISASTASRPTSTLGQVEKTHELIAEDVRYK